MAKLTSSPPWQQLQVHQQTLANVHMRDLFAQDHKRFDKFSLTAADLLLDYSKNRIDATTINLLLALANYCELPQKIDQLFAGDLVNNTELRPALHMALRDLTSKTSYLNNSNITLEIQTVLQKMQHWVETIYHEQWHGYSGKPITDIVNIGIGGSDLGPRMVNQALTPYAQHKVQVHFIANVDGSHTHEVLKTLNPETTLFIITSKTFSTKETLCNATTAREWLIKAAGNADIIKQHFIGVTANIANALAYGITAENILPFWEWIGGRYSLWSAVGLPIALHIGIDNFKNLLAGAHAMDEHFRVTALTKNMPVILGLLTIWYVNFFGAKTYAVLPYDYYLQLLPAYLQQLTMESNGKRIQKDGQPVDYDTAPILWGDVGVNGQHAFHQLLFQGTQLVPIDFILTAQSHNPLGQHHTLLFANGLAQSQALMRGKTTAEITAELLAKDMAAEQSELLAKHKTIPGNQPSNMLLMPRLTPKTLGALIALYEHKTFVESVIWNINPFDQWGVELGKEIANNLIPALEHTNSKHNQDSSTTGLLHYYKKFHST